MQCLTLKYLTKLPIFKEIRVHNGFAIAVAGFILRNRTAAGPHFEKTG